MIEESRLTYVRTYVTVSASLVRTRRMHAAFVPYARTYSLLRAAS